MEIEEMSNVCYYLTNRETLDEGVVFNIARHPLFTQPTHKSIKTQPNSKETPRFFISFFNFFSQKEKS